MKLLNIDIQRGEVTCVLEEEDDYRLLAILGHLLYNSRCFSTQVNPDHLKKFKLKEPFTIVFQ